MSLNKAIKYHKEKRKKYYGAKAVSGGCRNHGGCCWCEENRMYRTNKMKEETKSKLKEYNV